MGPVEERDPHHWRRVRYSYMDARRFANKQGLVLKGPKKVYYVRSANAGMLYAQRHGVFRRYNDLAFDRFWRRELDPENVDAVAALLGEAGAPLGFAAFLAGEGGAEHDKLRTKPLPTGSATNTKMIGMVRVCCSIAAVTGVLLVRMKSG